MVYFVDFRYILKWDTVYFLSKVNLTKYWTKHWDYIIYKTGGLVNKSDHDEAYSVISFNFETLLLNHESLF